MNRRWGVLAAAALLVTLAGCGEQGRDYAVPGDVCGVPVQPSLLEPLLPPGKKLAQSPDGSGIGTPRCEVTVDKGLALKAIGDVTTQVPDLPKVIQQKLNLAGNPRKIAVGDEAWVTDSTALATVKCVFQGQARLFITEVSAYGGPSDVTARRTALTAFITAYEPAARKAVGCDG
ncbi:hypothetical protein [Streptomyces sp. G-G2]|uniref:hypothetical protein n=1 Tax=Streptomyces sp. G-G2 TaxID=3046201 RepID=UPI0024BBB580|nr:hypothetical protein [Streptomyces sp. G-G2]MDJ0380715.1 hypothetical protein [Streptomyces sp. G-G2]